MVRKTIPLLLFVLCMVLLPEAKAAAAGLPGSPGLGDPYFPLAGNGGYDVRHYHLDLSYTPSMDMLAGTTSIRAVATQNLSQFNLDFEGLNISSITVNGRRAVWSRKGGELIVRPMNVLPIYRAFVVAVTYSGVPKAITGVIGTSGFITTTDGAIVAGQPQSAATWFPVNDHPSDKAAYTIKLTVPRALSAISNGVLESRRTNGAWTTWTWQAREPMASYLVTAAIGDFSVREYSIMNGVKVWDAIDTQLLAPVARPRTGTKFALSQLSNSSYKRLTQTIGVPTTGANMSFWIDRNTEPGWDFVFVEAHTVGQDDWTTLPDANGHTTQDTGYGCPYWLTIHPFLAHYQTDMGDNTCTPNGTTGTWWAASGDSDGWEQWSVDLGAWAGQNVEVSITHASDDFVQFDGAYIDDIVVSTGVGTTSFEDDGNILDGWTVPGAPADSPANPNDWIVGTTTDTPPPLGENVQRSFARQPEILTFLSKLYGRYPFTAAGGIVDSTPDISFALETQTRPIYSKGFFRDQTVGDSVVVHELAHQWIGDSVAVAQWQHIWLNEGFATYAEWMWSEHEGHGTTQEIFDYFYGEIPAEDAFWTVKIGDPGPDDLFHGAVYIRGAMTLHQLRVTVGDANFFRILRRWVQINKGGNVTSTQFIQLAEQVSGQDLDALFATWLYSAEKPVLNLTDQRRIAGMSARERPAAARPLNRMLTGQHK